LTENLGAALAMIESLRAGSVRPGGSDLAWALAACIDMFGPDRSAARTVVLITDGEDHPARWREMADLLVEERIVVHAIGLGDDREGAPIAASGAGSGGQVITRRVDAPLRFLADATGGRYVSAGVRRLDVAGVFGALLRGGDRIVRSAPRPRDVADCSILFLLPATLLLAAAGRARGRRGGSLAPFLLGSLLVSMLGMDEPRLDAGSAAFRAERYEDALRFYHEQITMGRSVPVATYNAGEVLFRLGLYAEAEEAYREAARDAPRWLAIKIEFARGNALTALGRYDEAIASYDACIARPAGTEGLTAVQEDARINREFVDELARGIAPDADSGWEAERERPDERVQGADQTSPARSKDAEQEGEETDGVAGEGADETPPGEAGGSRAPGEGLPQHARPSPSPLQRLASSASEIENSRARHETTLVPSSPRSDLPDW
jgi:tetratricopeptide (TPR) repeat protein